MTNPTAIRLAIEERRADFAVALADLHNQAARRAVQTTEAEIEAHRATLDLLAKAGADPGGATDACRFLGCSAADLLATVTSLYETRGGLVAEVADLRAKMSNLTGGADLTDDEIAAVWRRHTKLPAHCYFGKDDCAAAREFVNRGRAEERKAWQDATGCPTPDEARAKRERWTEVSRANLATIDDLRAQLDAAEAEADNLRRRVDIAEASRADQVRMHDRAQAALEEERARVAELEARPVLTVEALTALVEAMDDAVPAHAYLLIDAGTGTARLSFSMDGRFTKAEPLYRKHEVRRWVASIAADSTVTLPTPDRAEALTPAARERLTDIASNMRAEAATADRVSVGVLAGYADGIDRALASLATPSPRYVAVTASAVPPGTAPERVAWIGTLHYAMDLIDGMNNGRRSRESIVWSTALTRAQAPSYEAAILDTHAEPPPVADDLNRRAMEDSPAAKARRLREDMIATTKQMNAVASTTPAEVPPVAPRFVAVPRTEVNGRPAHATTTKAGAERYAAACNDDPSIFIDNHSVDVRPDTFAVVDTRPEGP